MELFRRPLAGEEREHALAMVRHLHAMAALRRLSTDIYEDAVHAADSTTATMTMLHREGLVSEPEVGKVVGEYLSPAIVRQLDILQSMAEKHRDMGVGLWPVCQKPYDAMTRAINVMLENAQCRCRNLHEGAVEAPAKDDAKRMDKAERKAWSKALQQLDELQSKRVKLGNEIIDIECDSINRVRASLRLAPLRKDAVYVLRMQEVIGNRVWFYRWKPEVQALKK